MSYYKDDHTGLYVAIAVMGIAAIVFGGVTITKAFNRWEYDIQKAFTKRLIFGLSESSKFKTIVKDEATVDVYGICL